MKQEKVLEQNRYYSFFEQVKELIYMCNAEGILIDINPAGVALLGYEKKDELLGIKFTDLFLNPEHREHYNKMIAEKGYFKDFELILKRKNGNQFFGLETAHVIKNHANEVIEYRGIIRDNTKRIQNEMLIRKMNLELVDINKKLKQTQMQLIHQEKLASIGQLAAGVAHEINNPLGFIRSNFTSLYKYIKTLVEFYEQFEHYVKDNNIYLENKPVLDYLADLKKKNKIDFILNDINSLFKETSEGFDRILNIIQGLKNFSRIESKAKIEQFDFNKAIEDTLLVARNEIKYIVNVKKELVELPLMEGLQNEINQVLLNIIINAAQAIKSQKKTGMGELRIKTYVKSGFIICTITDNGPGIPEQVVSKIFDPFFTTKKVGEGTGLGLSISYDVIKKHKGDINVKSKPGQGTCFIIKLPVKCQIKVEKK